MSQKKTMYSEFVCSIMQCRPILNFDLNLFLNNILKNASKNLSTFLTIYYIIIINCIIFVENFVTCRCCEVFADVNTISFTSFGWIINAWYCFKTWKTKLSGKSILILFLLRKQIKCIFVLTTCIKMMPGVRSIAMKSIRNTILTSERNRSWAPWGPFS